MNAAQMATALKTFGSLMSESQAVALTKFAQVFEGLEQVKAAAVAAQVAKNWKAEGRIAKRPAELAGAVGLIEQALTATGASAQARVFAKVLPLLVGIEQQDIDSFVREAIAARVKKAPQIKPPKKPKVQKRKFTDLAPELAERLKAVACERNRFDALLKEFEESYKATELQMIASRYMGFALDKKKKQDIVKAVRNWQREEELDADSHASQAKAGL